MPKSLILALILLLCQISAPAQVMAAEPTIRELRALQGKNDQASLQSIDQGLQSKKRRLRIAAAHALKGRTDAESIPVLEKALFAGGYERAEASEALQMRTDPAALKFIEEGISSTDRQRSHTFIMAMMGRSDEASLEILKRVYHSHPDNEDVRAATLAAASHRKDPGSLEFIREGLADTSRIVNIRAGQALADRKDSATEELLKEMLHHRTPDIVHLAANSLTKLNINYADQFINSDSVEMRNSAYFAIAYTHRGNPRYHEFMEKGANDPNASVREIVAHHYATINDERAYKILERVAFFKNEPEEDVRRSLLNVIRYWDDIGSTKFVMRMSLDPDPAISTTAKKAVQNRNRFMILSALEKMLYSSDTDDTQAAMILIASLNILGKLDGKALKEYYHLEWDDIMYITKKMDASPNAQELIKASKAFNAQKMLMDAATSTCLELVKAAQGNRFH